MRRGFLIRAVTASMLVAALAATPAAAETFHAGTPAGSNFTFLPLRIGIHEGIFAKEGLDLEVTDFGGGAKLQQAMVAGGIDLAVSAATDMAFIAKGAAEKAVAVVGKGTALGIVVPYDSPAKTPNGLKGKKIGVTTPGSFTEWLLKRFMGQRGWGPKDITIAYVGSGLANEIALITTHQLDGVVAPAAVGFELERSKRGRLLLSHFDLGPHFVGQALYASARIIDAHPDVVQRFVKGWFETIAWMRAHKSETVALTRSFTRFAPAVASREYDQGMAIFARNGSFDPVGMKALGHTFVEMKLLDHAPDMAKLHTTAFLPRK